MCTLNQWFALMLMTGLESAPAIEVSVDLSGPTVVCGQNQMVCVRIKNLSDREVVLRGFKVGYQLPCVEVRDPKGSWQPLGRSGTGSSDLTPGRLLLHKGQELSYRVALFENPGMAISRPGTYVLRASFPAVYEIDPTTGRFQEKVEWRLTPTQLVVKEPADRAAYELLLSTERQRWSKERPLEGEALFAAYRRFLADHGESPYAGEVRLRLAEELQRQNVRRARSVDKNVLSEVVGLLDTVSRSSDSMAYLAFPRLIEMYLRDRDGPDSAEARATMKRWLEVAGNDSEALAMRDRLNAIRQPEVCDTQNASQ